MRKVGFAMILGLLALVPLTLAEAKEKPLTITKEHNSATVQFLISHDVYSVQCDGDSFGVTVKGPPGLGVRIGDTNGVTNKHGIFTADVVPESNGFIFHSVAVVATFPDGAALGLLPLVYSCPFDGPYDLKLHVVKERNGKPFRDNVFIGFSGSTFTSTLARREFDPDRNGNLDITALHQDGVLPGSGWYVCADREADGPLRIASVNGEPNPFSTNFCQDLPALDGSRIEVVVER
jgi:hypothetical protein